MKLKNILESIALLTAAEKDKQLEEYKQLKKLLKELRKKRNDLEEKIAGEDDIDQCKELQDKLKIIDTQRRKGLDLLKELKESRKSS